MDDRSAKLRPVAIQHTPCKVCNADSKLLGVVDFARTCEDVSRAPAPLSGIPIYYHRCSACGFIFTVAFDDFTPADFAYWIYNDRYIEADHEYAEFRPTYYAEIISNMFSGTKQLPILDYGSGSGKLTEVLPPDGFTQCESYDPYVANVSQRPQGKFPIVLAFEVVEHSTQPREVFKDILSLTAPDGLTIFSTSIQPADIDRLGAQWWYAAPRNGHVSLYSKQSLEMIAAQHKLRMFSHPTQTFHMFIGKVPDFARHMQLPDI